MPRRLGSRVYFSRAGATVRTSFAWDDHEVKDSNAVAKLRSFTFVSFLTCRSFAVLRVADLLQPSTVLRSIVSVMSYSSSIQSSVGGVIGMHGCAAVAWKMAVKWPPRRRPWRSRRGPSPRADHMRIMLIMRLHTSTICHRPR
jgi:hypothetical protein